MRFLLTVSALPNDDNTPTEQIKAAAADVWREVYLGDGSPVEVVDLASTVIGEDDLDRDGTARRIVDRAGALNPLTFASVAAQIRVARAEGRPTVRVEVGDSEVVVNTARPSWPGAQTTEAHQQTRG